MFQVGDIVRGIPESDYLITNEKTLCEVVDIDSEGVKMDVKIIDDEEGGHWVGCIFGNVAAKFFHLEYPRPILKPPSNEDFMKMLEG